jgi:hypothetical protein
MNIFSRFAQVTEDSASCAGRSVMILAKELPKPHGNSSDNLIVEIVSRRYLHRLHFVKILLNRLA